MTDSTSPLPEETLVDFGHADLPPHEKTDRVRGVFTSVAARYDLMNDLMSLGVHRLWKRRLIGMMRPQSRQHLLDVAGGTGDIARRFLHAGGGAVTVCDLTPAMLEEGRKRLLDAGLCSNLDWVVGRAEDLPFEDVRFDCYTISFGLRNVSDRMAALREAFRVLRPGGHFLCLEFSPEMQLPALQKLYDRYSRLLPRLGGLVADDEASYRYLVESIQRFRHPDDLVEDLCAVGFDRVTATPLSGGIVVIHRGFKP